MNRAGVFVVGALGGRAADREEQARRASGGPKDKT